MKYKQVNISPEAVKENGFFSGYGSVFGVVDSYGDIVHKGAFAKSIERFKASNKMPKMLWQHKTDQPIGVWKTFEEDDHGLKLEGQLLIDGVQQAKEAYALLKAGGVDGLSIGYTIGDCDYNEKTDGLDLYDVNLMETSIVTFPANESAVVNSIKAKIIGGELPTLKEFENFLREAGFSRTQAAAIAGHGLRKLNQRDADDVKSAIEILQGIEL